MSHELAADDAVGAVDALDAAGKTAAFAGAGCTTAGCADLAASAPSPTAGAGAASWTMDLVFSESIAKLPKAAIGGTGAAAAGTNSDAAVRAPASLPGRTNSPSSIMMRTTFLAAAACGAAADRAAATAPCCSDCSSSLPLASLALLALAAALGDAVCTALPDELLPDCLLLAPPASHGMPAILLLDAQDPAVSTDAGNDAAASKTGARTAGAAGDCVGADAGETEALDVVVAAEPLRATGVSEEEPQPPLAARGAADTTAGDAGDRAAVATAMGMAAASALGSTYPPPDALPRLTIRATNGDRPAELAAPADRRESTDADRPSRD